MRKWKTLSTKTLLTHPRLKVYEDAVELPDGHRTEYLHFSYLEGAFVIAKNPEGKILVQKEYNYPIDDLLYHFPGGGFNHGGSPEEAALRELQEETGLTAKLQPLGWFYYDNRRSQDKQYYFLGEQLEQGAHAREIEEEIEMLWLSESEIDGLIRQGKIVGYSFLAGWSLYKAHSA